MKFFLKHLRRLFLVLIVIALTMQFAPKAMAASREEQLEQKIQQIVASIPASMTSDADIALYLHDYVVKNVAYQKVGDHQTAYGALLDGKAVCAGYADAYLRLLTAAGIEARTITGVADNGSGAPESHAWTMLIIDGKCLFTDVTWDDPFLNGIQDPNYISHDYFNITMEHMHKDHTPDEESKKYLPKSCNHSGYDYYTINQGEGTGYGIFSSSTTPQTAAKYFKYVGKVNEKDQFICEFRFDGDGTQWVKDNWVSIAQAIGLSGSLGVTYRTGGSTITMTLSGTFKQMIAVTSVSLSQSKLTLQAAFESYQLTATVSPENATNKGVTYKSSNTNVATVSNDGIVTAVANGTATITVTTDDGGKRASCSVTVSIPEPPAPPETQPTEPPTKPTNPPTQPTTPPTNPPTTPTSPSTTPTTPSQPDNTAPESTDPTTVPEDTEPTQPTDPLDPTEPTDPVDPPVPTEPTDPVQPSEPSDPQATEDVTQDATETPSETPKQPTSETQGKEGHQGKESSMTPVIIGACVAVALIVIPVAILIVIRVTGSKRKR